MVISDEDDPRLPRLQHQSVDSDSDSGCSPDPDASPTPSEAIPLVATVCNYATSKPRIRVEAGSPDELQRTVSGSGNVLHGSNTLARHIISEPVSAAFLDSELENRNVSSVAVCPLSPALTSSLLTESKAPPAAAESWIARPRLLRELVQAAAPVFHLSHYAYRDLHYGGQHPGDASASQRSRHRAGCHYHDQQTLNPKPPTGCSFASYINAGSVVRPRIEIEHLESCGNTLCQVTSHHCGVLSIF